MCGKFCAYLWGGGNFFILLLICASRRRRWSSWREEKEIRKRREKKCLWTVVQNLIYRKIYVCWKIVNECQRIFWINLRRRLIKTYFILYNVKKNWLTLKRNLEKEKGRRYFIIKTIRCFLLLSWGRNGIQKIHI